MLSWTSRHEQQTLILFHTRNTKHYCQLTSTWESFLPSSKAVRSTCLQYSQECPFAFCLHTKIHLWRRKTKGRFARGHSWLLLSPPLTLRTKFSVEDSTLMSSDSDVCNERALKQNKKSLMKCLNEIIICGWLILKEQMKWMKSREADCYVTCSSDHHSACVRELPSDDDGSFALAPTVIVIL